MVLSCFSDMEDKMRKIAKCFPNNTYENKLSKIDQEMGNVSLKA